MQYIVKQIGILGEDFKARDNLPYNFKKTVHIDVNLSNVTYFSWKENLVFNIIMDSHVKQNVLCILFGLPDFT